MSRIIRNAKLHVTHPGKTLNVDEREVIAKSFWSRQASCIVLERERTSPASVLIEPVMNHFMTVLAPTVGGGIVLQGQQRLQHLGPVDRLICCIATPCLYRAGAEQHLCEHRQRWRDQHR